MIRIDIDDRSVLQALEDLRHRVEDLTPAMAGIAAELASQTEARFAAQGPGWPSLAQGTILERIKSGHWPGKMLQRSGQLAASLQTEHGRDYAQIGTAKVYGAIHQFGGQAGRGRKTTIPARPFLPIDQDGALDDLTQRSILDILSDYLEG
jgi:phage virion morphogenesis protein